MTSQLNIDPNRNSQTQVHLMLMADQAEQVFKDSVRLSPRTVLFAEDNDDLRTVTDHFLSTMGFRVVSCKDGDMAATAFGTEALFDILLTNLEMPGKSGIELARELTTLRPSLPVVIVSGSAPSEELSMEMMTRNWTCMRKPYRLTVLVELLVSVLRSAQEASSSAALLAPVTTTENVVIASLQPGATSRLQGWPPEISVDTFMLRQAIMGTYPYRS